MMILFIRHAETDMAGTFCGHSDPDLNERGYAQLPALIEELRGQDITAVHTSDLRRACTTAQAIADAFRVKCHPCSALREINFGTWEGLRWNDILDRDPAYANRWLAEYPDLPAPRSEPFAEFEQRVLTAVQFLTKSKPNRNLAVVTHAGVLRIILGRLQNYSASEAWQRTANYCCIVPHTIEASSLESHHEVKQ